MRLPSLKRLARPRTLDQIDPSGACVAWYIGGSASWGLLAGFFGLMPILGNIEKRIRQRQVVLRSEANRKQKP